MNPQNTAIYQLWGWVGVAVLAVAILLATALVCHLVIRGVRKGVAIASHGERALGSIFGNIIRACIWLAGVALMLYFCFDFNAGVIWGALGIGGVAVSLGAQTTISNLFGGLQTSFAHEVSIGDWVTIGAITGQVKDITWRQVIIEDTSGDTHFIPNSLMVSTTVTRHPLYGKVVLPLVLASDCAVDAVSAELPDVVLDALVHAGMDFEGKRPVLTVAGTELAGVTCSLIVFCSRDFTTAQVSDVAMDAALAYLKGKDALPRSVAAQFQ